MFVFIIPTVGIKEIRNIDNSLECIIEQKFKEKLINYHLPTKKSFELTKRIFDLFICIFISPIAFLFIAFFGIAIKLETPGPIFFKQIRCGKNGKLFVMYKLRSFRKNNNTAKWTEKNDPNITFFGKIVRKTRIDELPQIWNIIKGEMSIIGPRPEQPELVIDFLKTTPDFILRNFVKPGITGWAQINGGYDLTPREKILYDIYYIKKRSIWFDFIIMIRTFGVVLTGNGAL